MTANDAAFLVIIHTPPRPKLTLTTALANTVNNTGGDLHLTILPGSSLELVAESSLPLFGRNSLQLQPICTYTVHSSVTSDSAPVALDLSLPKLATCLERVFRLERIRQHLAEATAYAMAREKSHECHDAAAHNQQGELGGLEAFDADDFGEGFHHGWRRVHWWWQRRWKERWTHG
jgi:hypothetical protein